MKTRISSIKPFYSEGRIIEQKREYTGYLDLLIENRVISNYAKPGQFVMVKGWSNYDPVLARPFDIVQTDPLNNLFRLIIKITGRGTELLNLAKVGDMLKITGPLGNPVNIFANENITLFVRGVGAASVVYLAEAAKKRGADVHTILSASTKSRLVCRNYLEETSTRLSIATDDGSEGFHGDARDLLKQYIREMKPDRIYTCGSKRFARFVRDLDNKGLTKGYVFLESYMACGIGDCHGCAVNKKNSTGYFLVCKDGPVFPVNSVELE